MIRQENMVRLDTLTAGSLFKHNGVWVVITGYSNQTKKRITIHDGNCRFNLKKSRMVEIHPSREYGEPTIWQR